MKTYSFLAVACTLALATILFFGASSDVAFAASHHVPAAGLSLGDILTNITPYAASVLTVLRADLDTLNKQATDKIAELKDDTPADKARSIDEEHKAILKKIEDKKEEIRAAEAAERDRDDDTPPSNAEAARAADILDYGTRAGMEISVIQAAIRSGTSLDSFRAQAFEHLASRAASGHTSPGRVQTDEQETRRNAMIEALSYRFGAPLPEGGPSAAARAHMDHGIVTVAAEVTGYRGIPRNGRDIEGIFERAAHTTSDFPVIMEGAINRTLETRYRLAQPTYRRISRQRNFRDFRPHSSINVGDFPMLLRVLEDGEIKFGKLTEGKETLQVLSYARAISITRQVMINDDIGAIQDMLSSYGSTVALFEEITFYSQAFNAKLSDGKTVFHADHGNLAGSGAAIDVDTVSAGRAAMSKQKTLDGNPMLVNTPSILLTGPDSLTAAEKLVASIVAAQVANVNIFSGRLNPLETAQITDKSWYLFPNPEQGSNYRWGYLEGYEAPRVRIENPFGRQGMAMSVEHDFGCGAVDYRYGWKNQGPA
jgi:hypothetical protein